jgi:hypothetical protein
VFTTSAKRLVACSGTNVSGSKAQLHVARRALPKIEIVLRICPMSKLSCDKLGARL